MFVWYAHIFDGLSTVEKYKLYLYIEEVFEVSLCTILRVHCTDKSEEIANCQETNLVHKHKAIYRFLLLVYIILHSDVVNLHL